MHCFGGNRRSLIRGEEGEGELFMWECGEFGTAASGGGCVASEMVWRTLLLLYCCSDTCSGPHRSSMEGSEIVEEMNGL